MFDFDQCDHGKPCMQSTTGCTKGQCVRRNPHAFSTVQGSRNVCCVICGNVKSAPIHAGRLVLEIPNG